MDTNTQSINGRVNEHDPTVGQLRQNLVRTTLAKQTLEYEKKELLRRIEELERGMPFTGGKNKNDIATSPSIPALLSVVGENEKRLRELISREKVIRLNYAINCSLFVYFLHFVVIILM